MKVAEAARELGVSDYLLTKWVRTSAREPSSPDGEEILRKAITFFREHQV